MFNDVMYMNSFSFYENENEVPYSIRTCFQNFPKFLWRTDMNAENAVYILGMWIVSLKANVILLAFFEFLCQIDLHIYEEKQKSCRKEKEGIY